MFSCGSKMEGIEAMYAQTPTMCKVAGGILVASAGAALLHRLLRRGKEDKERPDYPRDTVILHQIGRGPHAPSITPFAVKLETYLRMANIPYQNEHGWERSSKQKFPWITYNGQDVADSSFCIHYLNQHLNVDLNAWLSTQQKAVAVALQRLVEDDLYWILLVTRWVNEMDEQFMKTTIGLSARYVRWFISPTLRKMAYAQGMGRHLPEEIEHIMRTDLTALTDYLGSKKFMMGEQACEVDCAVFGQLSQLYWQLPSNMSRIFKEEYPTLVSYCERMRTTYWPDWDECTTQGGTTTATK